MQMFISSLPVSYCLQMGLAATLVDIFWEPSFWLPNNHTWKELEDTPGFTYPDWRDIFIYPSIIAVFTVIIRAYILYPFLYSAIGRSLGLAVKKTIPPMPNKTLESIYVTNKGCVPSKAIEEAAVSLQLTQRQVERWMRNRSAVSKITKEDKFNESAFIFSYHFIVGIYCLFVIFPKPWYNDISLCFSNYPFNEVEPDVWCLYIMTCSFYLSQLMWQIKHSHGNDSNLAYVHHICTLFLIAFSWMCNFIRIGSLVILVTEFGGDVFLQLMKMCRYVKLEKYVEFFYLSFAVSWLLSRMVIYPVWICYYVLFEAPKMLFMPSAFVFYFLLFALLLINCCWTSFLVISLYRRVVVGRIENVASSDDARSNEKCESDSKTN